ncbi:PLP-dependent aminotransferase family protein [Aestuariirhabdus litorea]|uniref:PLP-dependent aminotransferase family protein n=1 Tax=Aestuariirhabdus litorea TaxID=2528527 RepID=A0A3P3VMV8_9GAMM|nr:PLP-dependent aminotransferase family protein [Aestuariirhabdus litorea]RRJ83764.1 PLP-dependent aminotransferase family protein [Aestuariirhabdus litorea]RWW96987.1 aminotransferase class I/II-fold pyridoxal phosphate-dependent enzyme [Endozoicomonadaceae bacterium GTF-13]
MDSFFSDRISDVPRSFIREILKVAIDPTIISFAGGLPNRQFFPAEELQRATQQVFERYGRDLFQYSNSEGFLPLRQWIAERYRKTQGLEISPESILITSGSQQGLDLLGKVLLNEGEGVLMEAPGYLGAIQAFSIYRPEFMNVAVDEQGMVLEELDHQLARGNPKLAYSVPNFQNPAGISYSDANREAVAQRLRGKRCVLVEDNPYGDLRFSGTPARSFYELLPGQTVLLGSFSKCVIPGFRLGWLVAPEALMQKLLVAKQATDLHTSHFTQCIVHQYLMDNDIDAHIATIVDAYGDQCRAMMEAMDRHFPSSVRYTRPDGGMFLWVTLPGKLSAMALFEEAVKQQVVFVPGDPFYTDQQSHSTLRLSFSCVDAATIEVGIERLGLAIKKMLGEAS